MEDLGTYMEDLEPGTYRRPGDIWKAWGHIWKTWGHTEGLGTSLIHNSCIYMIVHVRHTKREEQIALVLVN